jgi:hypothetical protein
VKRAPLPPLGLVGDTGEIVLKRRMYCGHRKLVVDESKREVTCEQCNKVLDPYEALAHLAHGWEPYRFGIEQAKRENERRQLELEETKRLVRNVRAQLERLVKRLPTGPRGA